MVYFQVEDVEKKFEHLSELEKNGWKERAQKPKGRKTKVESEMHVVMYTSLVPRPVRGCSGFNPLWTWERGYGVY